MRWTNNLPGDVYERLCHCRSTKSDIKVLVDARWNFMKDQGKDKQGYTKEDAIVMVLELLDENGQVYDLTHDEYNELD